MVKPFVKETKTRHYRWVERRAFDAWKRKISGGKEKVSKQRARQKSKSKVTREKKLGGGCYYMKTSKVERKKKGGGRQLSLEERSSRKVVVHLGKKDQSGEGRENNKGGGEPLGPDKCESLKRRRGGHDLI